MNLAVELEKSLLGSRERREREREVVLILMELAHQPGKTNKSHLLGRTDGQTSHWQPHLLLLLFCAFVSSYPFTTSFTLFLRKRALLFDLTLSCINAGENIQIVFFLSHIRACDRFSQFSHSVTASAFHISDQEPQTQCERRRKGSNKGFHQ